MPALRDLRFSHSSIDTNAGNRRCREGTDQAEEFLNRIRLRVRDIEDVLVVDLKCPRQEERIRVAQIQPIYDRDKIAFRR